MAQPAKMHHLTFREVPMTRSRSQAWKSSCWWVSNPFGIDSPNSTTSGRTTAGKWRQVIRKVGGCSSTVQYTGQGRSVAEPVRCKLAPWKKKNWLWILVKNKKLTYKNKNNKVYLSDFDQLKLNNLTLFFDIWSVLGTYTTFSSTAPLSRTKKGGARRGGANLKNNGAVAVALIRAISAHFRTKLCIKIS